jgi:hypothetical protein
MVMDMRDVTDLFNRYRECVLSIWNGYLKEPDQDIRFDVRDRWADACVFLFRALVLYPLDYDDPSILPEYRGEQQAIRVIRVVPIKECEILINENPHSGVWEPTTSNLEDVDLRFISFWDWDVLGKREFEYVKVLIDEWTKYPEKKNKLALIKTSDAKIMFDERALVEGNGE